MGRLTAVYDGQDASKLTRDDLIKAILREFDVIYEENTLSAMVEAFRCGFLRGEDYTNSMK
jgi:translation elongation factor EF-4